MTDEDFKALIGRFDYHLERIDRHIEDNRRVNERLIDTLLVMTQRLEDMGDEIRANTKAVLAMLDRFDGPGQAA